MRRLAADLPDEPLAETVLQDGFGRAAVVYQASAVAGLVAGAVRWVVHRVRFVRRAETSGQASATPSSSQSGAG